MGPEPDPDAARAAIEYCYEHDWTDGLPVVPASEALLEQFLATTTRSPDEVLWRMDHLDRECTVRTAAINAAMAGCLPEYFPIVLAAWDAVMRDRAAKGGGWQSTSGPAPLIVINGPIRVTAFGVPPHVFAQTTQGIPGRWAICFGENEEESPWEPLAVETGLEPGARAVSCTLTRTYEFVDNRHTQDPEQLLNDFADTIGRTGSLIFRGQSAGVVFCPEHAQMLAGAGYSKGDVQDWFIEQGGSPETDLRRAGKDGVSGSGPGARSASES